jgi:tetratricopeptide (TPR) repeat protein
LETFIALYGAAHESVALTYSAFAAIHCDAMRYTVALDLYTQALGITAKSCGPDHARTQLRIGEVYCRSRSYEEALSWLSKARITLEKVYGARHEDVADADLKIAHVYCNQSRFEEARQLLIEARTTFENVYGKAHESVATAVFQLGVVERYTGNLETALDCFEYCIRFTEAFNESADMWEATNATNQNDKLYFCIHEKNAVLGMMELKSATSSSIAKQMAKGLTSVSLIRGAVGSAACDVERFPERRISFLCPGSLSTLGACDAIARHGKVFYEVRVLEGGDSQFGWASNGTLDVADRLKLHHGVGADGHSWGVAVEQERKWHNACFESWPCPPCRMGDVLGVAADIDGRTILFGVNGRWKVAFSEITVDGGIFPALSAEHGQYQLNLGDEPNVLFKYGPPDGSFDAVATCDATCCSDLATVRNRIAMVFWKLGRADDALQMFQRASAVAPTGSHSDADSQHGMALLYWNQKRYSEAMSLSIKAHAIYETLHGTAHPSVSAMQRLFAAYFSEQGLHSESMAAYQKALATEERIYGAGSAQVASCRTLLAKAYYAQKCDEAALATVVDALIEFGTLLRAKDALLTQEEQARQLADDQSWRLLDRTSSPSDTERKIRDANYAKAEAHANAAKVVTAQHVIAPIFTPQELEEKALTSFAEAAQLCMILTKSKFGITHVNVAAALCDVAVAYEVQGRSLQMALESFSQALEVLKACCNTAVGVSVADHVVHADTERALAKVDQTGERLRAAAHKSKWSGTESRSERQGYIGRVNEMWTTILQLKLMMKEKELVRHGVTCDASGMLPIIDTRYHKIGEDYDLCEAEFAKLSEADKSLYEKIDPRHAIFAARKQLADAKKNQHDLKEALSMYTQILENGGQIFLGTANVAQVRISIGDIHTEFDRNEEAMLMYSEAIMLSKANGLTDGLEEDEMQDLALEMARCLERVGKDDQALRIYMKLLARIEDKRAADCDLSAARLLYTIGDRCSRSEASVQAAVACFDRAIAMSRLPALSDDDESAYGYERGCLASVAIDRRSQLVERGLRLGDIVVFRRLSDHRYDSWLLPGMLGVLCEFDIHNSDVVYLTVDWDSSKCRVCAKDLVPLKVSQIEVTGCAIVNGSYIECETERNGRKCFGKADGNGSIYFDGEYWKLRQNSYSGLFDGHGSEEGSDLSWTFSQLPLGDSTWPSPVWGLGVPACFDVSVLGGLVSDRLRSLSTEIRAGPPGDTIADILARNKNARRAAVEQRVNAEIEGLFGRTGDEALGSASMQARC